MSEYTAPKLSFSLHEPSSSAFATRTGSLTLTHHATSSPPPFSQSIQTPAIVHYTKKGSPVHLSRDNVDRLPIDMVAIAMEHFLDYNPPIYTEAPCSLTRYIGLRDKPVQQPASTNSKGKERNPHITIASLRDPADLVDIVANTDQMVACRSYRGVSKVTPEQFIGFALPRPPDILIALADEPLGLSHSQKRTTKSLLRSEKWLSKTLEAGRDRTNVFAPLIGGTSRTARHEYAATLNVQPVGESTLASTVSGFCINLNTLRPSPSVSSSTSPDAPVEDYESLITASLSPLPRNKPRLALCPEGPHEILRLIALGIDMFMDEWSSMLSSVGVALNFRFSQPTTERQDRRESREQLGINLFSDEYSRDFTSLASKELNEVLIKRYSSEGLGDSPTRGYIHHLLHSHEMTSHVLLAMHNTCVMDLFMHDVRESIQAGTFTQDKKRFEERYSEKIDCLVDAREEWSRVNKERGKGRLKGFGMDRKTDGKDISVTNEQERMSVVDAVDQLKV